MKKIYKYIIELKGRQIIKMPAGAEILCVQNQIEQPCIWALVDPQCSETERTILTFGTGHEIEVGPLKYIGTCQLEGGILIGHVFELLK